MGAGLSGSSGQASPVKRRHYTNAALAEQAIVSYTKQQPQVQLIALTTQGRSAAGRAVFGSVAEQVFASLPTSLLLLHPPKAEQTASAPPLGTPPHPIILPPDAPEPPDTT